jgi:hypothetical protein
MPIIRTGTTLYDRELAKWDTPKNQRVRDAEGNETAEMGMGAVGFEPFPRMVYKAHRRENGKVMCYDLDAIYAVDVKTQALADAFNRSCEKTVHSQSEYERARDEGWADTPAAALAHYEALQQDIATAAAEAAYSVRRMSEQARTEFAQADAQTEHPVTDVRKKPGPKPKTPMVTVP